MFGQKMSIKSIVKMNNLIKKILKEQVTTNNFCIPVKGWDGGLNNNQNFSACRSICLEYDPTDNKKCIRWDNCGRQHNAVDFAVPSGTEVNAPADGVVTASYITSDGCGGMVIIEHDNNIKTKYCHLKKRSVKKDDLITKGQLIGLVGGDINDVGRGNSEDSHLHYQVRKNNSPIDPKANGYLNGGVCGETTVIAQDKNGMNPNIIRSIQEWLALGEYYYDDVLDRFDYEAAIMEPTVITGIMDEDTIEAIKYLQEYHGLTVNGVMDKETFLVLKNEVLDKY